MILLKKYKGYITGLTLGGLAGYAYYYFIGCANGQCLITSNPLNSVLYGSLTGLLAGHSTNKKA